MLVLLLACAPRLPDPTVESVVPDRGWQGEETLVAVEGSNFFPQVEVNANRRGQSDLDRGFQAWLEGADGGRYPLGGVGATDYDTLTAVVPAGLPVGSYDVVVEGPTGRQGRGIGVYAVTDTRADRFSVTADSIAWTVNDLAFVEVQVVDPRGQPVLTDLLVNVRVEGVSGPIAVEFGAALAGQAIDVDGLGITGGLGPDGRSLVPISVATPDTVEVSVDPVDPTSPVRRGALQLLWQPGVETTLEITLPADPFEVDAGTPFEVQLVPRDAFGNVVADLDRTVLLQTACADWTAAVDLQGPTAVQVVPTRSTLLQNPGCSSQRVVALAGVPGQSAPFVVRPGPADRFLVEAAPPVLRAGEEVNALVSPRDAFGNRASLAASPAIQDTLGGLRQVICVPFTADDRVCRGVATLAGTGVRLVASVGALTGESAPYDVLPSLEVTALEIEAAPSVVAGEPTSLAVRALDVFGNAIPAADAGPVAIDDDLGEAECEAEPPLPDGRLSFACAAFTARAGARWIATSGAASSASSTFEVVNGPLALVIVGAPPSATAGEPFPVQLTAFDGFGNPVLDPPGSTVEVETPGAVLSFPLDAQGTSAGDVVLTTAQPTTLYARFAGAEVGASAPIAVGPGPAVAWRVGPATPWVFAGGPAEIRVSAVDAFGNRGVESATVTVTGASLPAPAVVEVAGGLGGGTAQWSQGAPAEVLTASGGGLSGVSAPFVVAERCGGAGPTAVMDFAGAPTGRACLDPAVGSAPLALSLAGSTAGDAPIVRRLASVDGAAPVESAGAVVPISVTRIGESRVDALVLDGAACGSEASSSAWAGPDDGQPVGRLAVAADDAQIVVGSGSTGVRVEGAVDCTGDPASAGALRIRADRGELVGATPTGAGLVLELDPTGSAFALLDASGARSGGLGTVRLSSPSGGAAGSLTVELVGDDRLPTVWSQSPSGPVDGFVDTLSLAFDEPMLAGTVVPGAFEVAGPFAATVASATLVEPARVELSLDAPIDASAGTWTLTASAALRDASGNRLDGGSTGAPGAWVQAFGAVSATVDGVACQVAPERFRPDGDPGPGEEADAVVVSLQSPTAPAWWLASVRSPDGALVARERVRPMAPVDAWTWDGRDASGRVVDPGVWTITVEPLDALGNRGAACAVVVALEQEGGP